jgi:hypothetical protein
MGWECGSNTCLQVQGPEFKPQYCKKKKVLQTLTMTKSITIKLSQTVDVLNMVLAGTDIRTAGAGPGPRWFS